MRAQRIHHTQRLKAKRRTYKSVMPTPKGAGIALHSPARCSCWSCGNPRKFFDERTIQERREMQEACSRNGIREHAL